MPGAEQRLSAGLSRLLTRKGTAFQVNRSLLFSKKAGRLHRMFQFLCHTVRKIRGKRASPSKTAHGLSCNAIWFEIVILLTVSAFVQALHKNFAAVLEAQLVRGTSSPAATATATATLARCGASLLVNETTDLADQLGRIAAVAEAVHGSTIAAIVSIFPLENHAQ